MRFLFLVLGLLLWASPALSYGSGHCNGVYNRGYNDGYNKGQKQGFQSGKKDGYNIGKNDGWGLGRTHGYEQGLNDCYKNKKEPEGPTYDEGYQKGYKEGYESAESEYPETPVLQCISIFKWDGRVTALDKSCKNTSDCDDGNRNTVNLCALAQTPPDKKEY